MMVRGLYGNGAAEFGTDGSPGELAPLRIDPCLLQNEACPLQIDGATGTDGLFPGTDGSDYALTFHPSRVHSIRPRYDGISPKTSFP